MNQPPELSAPPKSPRKKPRPAPVSAQSKWIGFVVLGFGVVAVAAVILMALNMNATPAEQAQQELADSVKSMPSEESVPEPATEYKRQKNVKPADITGMWQTNINGGKAVVQIENGVYRIVVSFDNRNLERRYSNGTYRMVDDVMILTPRTEWGPPTTDGAEYRPLTVSEFPLLVARDGKKLVWQNPKRADVADGDIYIPNVNPFLTLTQNGVAVWEKL